MPIATCFAPDGSQLCHKKGEPLVYERQTQGRARLSAIKAWWPGSKGPARKESKDLDPRKLHAPEGSSIHIDDVLTYRFERVGVDAAGHVTEDPEKLVATRLDWVDVAAKAYASEEEAMLNEYRKRLEQRRADARAANIEAYVATQAKPVAETTVPPEPVSRRRP